jgi:hypothetical protein
MTPGELEKEIKNILDYTQPNDKVIFKLKEEFIK